MLFLKGLFSPITCFTAGLLIGLAFAFLANFNFDTSTKNTYRLFRSWIGQPDDLPQATPRPPLLPRFR